MDSAQIKWLADGLQRRTAGFLLGYHIETGLVTVYQRVSHSEDKVRTISMVLHANVYTAKNGHF